MEWIERLNKAIDYIEENLTGEIDHDRLGQIACCSSFHFQRMFTFMAGIPLSEYIRRRKMSLATVDLQNGEKVIDVGIKYGYSSPTAFNRAFQSVHGIPPSKIRGEGVSVRSFPKLSFKITVKGVVEMNYRIEKRDAFRIVGVSIPLEKDIEKNFAQVPAKWDEVSSDGTLQKLAGMMEPDSMGILGVCAGNEEQMRYYIAVESRKDKGDWEEYTVPASTWAVFPGEGTSQSIQELERRVVTEWLPTSGYEYADAPDIEVYLNADPENAKYEVWIPVKK